MVKKASIYVFLDNMATCDGSDVQYVQNRCIFLAHSWPALAR